MSELYPPHGRVYLVGDEFQYDGGQFVEYAFTYEHDAQHVAQGLNILNNLADALRACKWPKPDWQNNKHFKRCVCHYVVTSLFVR